MPIMPRRKRFLSYFLRVIECLLGREVIDRSSCRIEIFSLVLAGAFPANPSTKVFSQIFERRVTVAYSL